MKPIIVLTCLIAAALAVPAQAEQGKARMYKCVDAAGKVYYSDKMNPDCGKGSELNLQGVVMPKEKEVAKPTQPSKANPEQVTSKTSQEQERRDRALVETYATEEEIDAARDRSLSLPALGMKTIESKLVKVNQRLAELTKQSDALGAKKKPLPATLPEEIIEMQKNISAWEADLARRQAQLDAIRIKFEFDKKRFRELKGASPASQ